MLIIHSVVIVPSLPIILSLTDTVRHRTIPKVLHIAPFWDFGGGVMQSLASTEVISLCASVTLMDYNCILHLFACLFVFFFPSPLIPAFLFIYFQELWWAGHVEFKGDKRNAYKILVEKPEGKTPLGRYRRRRLRDIKMAKIGWNSGELK